MIDDSKCDEFVKDWQNVEIKKPTIGPKRAKVCIRPSAIWLERCGLQLFHERIGNHCGAKEDGISSGGYCNSYIREKSEDAPRAC
jgi:hypothetical protein